MTGLFSFALYKQGLKRTRAAGAAITIASVGTELVNAITMKVRHCEKCDRTGIRDIIMADDIMMGSILLLLLAPILTYLMFSFLHKRSSADFYHAMPHKRTTVYISYTAALFTWLFGILVLNCGASAYGFGEIRGFDVDPVRCLELLAYYASATLIVVGATLTAVMITGRAVSAFFTAGVFVVVPVQTVLWFERALGNFYSHYDYISGALKYIGTESNVLYKLFDGPASITAVISSAVLGFLWLVLGGIGYAKRKSETASLGFASGKIKVFTASLFAFSFIFKGFCGFYYGPYDVGDSYTAIFVGIVAMFVYMYISTKSAKEAFKAMPWLLAVFAVSGAVLGCAYLTGQTMEKNVPKNVEDIESVAFNVDALYLEREVEYDFSTMEVKDKELISYAVSAMNNKLYRGYRDAGISITFKLKNGKTIYRRIEDELSNNKLLERYIIENEPEINRRFMPLPQVSRFESEEQRTLWELFTEEYYSASMKERESLKGANYNSDRCIFRIYVINSQGKEKEYKFNAKEDVTPKTYEFLRNQEKNQ